MDEIINSSHVIGLDSDWYGAGSLLQNLLDAGYSGWAFGSAIYNLIGIKLITENKAKIILRVEKNNEQKYRIVSVDPNNTHQYGMVADNIPTEHEAKSLARISLVMRQYHTVETLTEKDITPEVITKALKEWKAYQSDQEAKAKAHQDFHNLDLKDQKPSN